MSTIPPRCSGLRRGSATVSDEKADDMQRQQHAAHVAGRKVAIVTDSAADIPEDELDRLGIHMVPVRVHFGERSYLDKVGITSAEFFDEIRRNPLRAENFATAARRFPPPVRIPRLAFRVASSRST